MVTCCHGNPIGFNSILCSHCNALRVLELSSDATEKEIKDAYRLLVKVWHPDRFEGDDAIQEAAEAKLKQINAAYILLTSRSPRDGSVGRESSPGTGSGAGSGTGAQSPPFWTEYGAAEAGRAEAEWVHAWERARDHAQVHERSHAHPRSPSNAAGSSFPFWLLPPLTVLIRLAILVFALLAGRDLLTALDLPNAADNIAAKISGYGNDSELFALDDPKRRFAEAVEQDLRRIGLKETAYVLEEPGTSRNPLAAARMASHASLRNVLGTAPGNENSPHAAQGSLASKAAPIRIDSHLTIGSTGDEVLDKLGEPTASAANKLVYGRSELYFEDDRVVGWRIDPFLSPIPVRLWPSASVDPTTRSFTVGSSKDVVLVAQGTPTAFSEDKFEYAGSEVDFKNQRVVGWKSDPATIPLRARVP